MRKKDLMKNKLHIYSQVRTLSLKFYDEQIPNGEDEFIENIKAIDSNEYQVLAIKHDRDIVKNNDDPFEVSCTKPHWHLYLRVLSKTNKPRIYQLLSMLGIVYREDLDKKLWNNKGVETCRDFTTCAVYGLHKTAQAQEDGKFEYDIEDYVSNLTIGEIEQVMQGYKRLECEVTRPTTKTLEELANRAEKLGYELKSFDEWWDNLPFNLQSHSKMKIIEKRYMRGIEKRINDKDNNKVNRLCVFIKGEGNKGKTYAAMEALKNEDALVVGGGGSGKYDKLQVTNNAIIVDDDVVTNLLNMTDNYFCQAYRRNSNNPTWCGEYFVVTSNKSFEEWVEECGLQTTKYNSKMQRWEETDSFKALKTRFYICEVVWCENGYNILYCHEPSKRGSYEDQEKRYIKYDKFRDIYNASLKSYSVENKEFDYSKLNGDVKKVEVGNEVVKEKPQSKEQEIEVEDSLDIFDISN